MNHNSLCRCKAIPARVRVSNKHRAQHRQIEEMGGENEEKESKAICTFPPTALPALWCEGQSVTNLWAVAELPFLSGCTCFTTLHTFFRVPLHITLYTPNTDFGENTSSTHMSMDICERTHTQTQGYTKKEWEWRSRVIKMMYWVKVILSLRC